MIQDNFAHRLASSAIKLGRKLGASKAQNVTSKSTTYKPESRQALKHWKFEEFKTRLHLHATEQVLPREYPDRIHFTPLQPLLQRMQHLALTSRVEVGRALIYNTQNRELKVTARENGTEDSVVIKAEVSNFRKMVLVLHTHPHSSGGNYRAEHFSAEDCISLLVYPDTIGSVVVTSRSSIMLLKAHSHCALLPPESIKNKVYELFNSARKMTTSSADVARIATKLVCIEFGLELFLINPDEAVAKKVLLVPDVSTVEKSKR